jgi:hypothetical protein
LKAESGLKTKSMARGDQIYVMREFLNLKGVYEHHGIDCGDGTVIHYRKGDETIARTSMATFADGRTIYVKPYSTSFIPDVVVRRAEGRLGERKYNLLFNNCEHFATWCKTGVNESCQVKDFLPALDRIGADRLFGPVIQALGETSQNSAQQAVRSALATIKVAWEDIQPKYVSAKQDTETWQRVAVLALKQGREDLARAAIQRKQQAQQEAKNLEAQLQQLAALVDRLTHNSLDLGIATPEELRSR